MVPTRSSLGLGDIIQDTGVLYGIDTERYTYCMVPTLPSPPEDADQGLPPPLKMPPLHDKQAWSQYHSAIDRARRIQRDPTDLLTAMGIAAVACGI